MSHRAVAEITHAVVGVSDLDTAVAAWRAAGFEPGPRGAPAASVCTALRGLAGTAREAFLLAPGDGAVQLVETPWAPRTYRPLDRRPLAVVVDGPSPPPPPGLLGAPAPTPAVRAIRFRVADVEAAARTLTALGLVAVESGGGERMFRGRGGVALALSRGDAAADAGTLPTMPLHPGLHAAALRVASVDGLGDLGREVALGEPVTDAVGGRRARTMEIAGSVRLEVWHDV